MGKRRCTKTLMVHSYPTLKPPSIRLLLALPSISGLPVWTSDSPKDYFKYAIPLARDLFLETVIPELHL